MIMADISNLYDWSDWDERDDDPADEFDPAEWWNDTKAEEEKRAR